MALSTAHSSAGHCSPIKLESPHWVKVHVSQKNSIWTQAWPRKKLGSARIINHHTQNILRNWKHQLTIDSATKTATLRDRKAVHRSSILNLFHCLHLQKPSGFYLYWNGVWLQVLKINLFKMHPVI